MLDLFDIGAIPQVLHVRVTPKAKLSRIKREVAPDASIYYKVYVTVAAEDGKANQAVIELLAKALGISKSSLAITHGLTSRNKIIQVKVDK